MNNLLDEMESDVTTPTIGDNSLKEMAEIQLVLKDYKKAIKYALKSLEIVEQTQKIPLIRDVSSVLSKAFIGDKNYKKG